RQRETSVVGAGGIFTQIHDCSTQLIQEKNHVSLEMKKPVEIQLVIFGGEGGIRTLDFAHKKWQINQLWL
ncbi:hypothetical protein ACEUCS_19930, partial [Aeromonas caviae]|uniref:hypothetical protein n=1 Tax=Aeromonas caviae TaxID=648 RepID=UPI0038CFEDDA